MQATCGPGLSSTLLGDHIGLGAMTTGILGIPGVVGLAGSFDNDLDVPDTAKIGAENITADLDDANLDNQLDTADGGTSVYRTARIGAGQSELDSGLDPVNFATGDQSAYVGDESAARTFANPSVGNYENFYTRFDMNPAFESEFADYQYRCPSGGPDSYEYQIPQSLINRFNSLTISRTAVPFEP
jgi:hypothetical protein